MFDKRLDELDADETLTRVSALRAAAERADLGILQAAAHWADLHGVAAPAPDGPVLRGMERPVRLGGEGTPEVAEFAPAELGAELGVSPYAATVLIGDALDLRHRLPVLGQRIVAGEVKPWLGRKVAQRTRDHDPTAAAAVDAQVAPWADRLGWARLEAVVDAALIAADPERARADAAERRSEHGVWLGRSNDAETGTAFIRGDAVDLRFFDTGIDRIADGLGLLGDTSTKQARRARAVGVIANPQHTLVVYEQAADAAATCDSDDLPDGITSDHGLAEADAQGADASGSGQATHDPASARRTAPAPAGTQPARRKVDPRPPAVLYVHLSEAAITGGAGVARVEGVGPVSLDQAKKWLGHGRVTIQPVLDIAGMAPVGAYEIPDRMREAAHLMTPADVFPYATGTGRKRDIDHTEPYRDPGDGGPPGQTRIGNLGPMTRRHHRIKTHGRWQVQQPFPGIYLWRSPHGRHYLVDHTGTRRLRGDAA